MESKCISMKQIECCGCGVCAIVCPLSAITMIEDEYGFSVPIVDKKKCVNCGKCKSKCAFINSMKFKNVPAEKVYAAAIKDKKLIENSASGGIFAGAAKYIINQGGIVYGAAWQKDFSVKHIGVRKLSELNKLQGSKYTQSDISECLCEIAYNLANGEKVLFSGTPCQVAAVKSFLGKDYTNFYTIDLICHGVGSNKFVQEDISFLEKKYGAKINSIEFRTKRKGWGTAGDVIFDDCIKEFNTRISPYYYYYLGNALFRESCYVCPYSCDSRSGELTIGDYWRIENAHPDTEIDYQKGVSCLLINSSKGQSFFEEFKDTLELTNSSLDKIKTRNANLVEPCKKPEKRKDLQQVYLNDGYDGIVKFWDKKEKLVRGMLLIKCFIPPQLKKIIKQLMR